MPRGRRLLLQLKRKNVMLRITLVAAASVLLSSGPAIAQDRIQIVSEWGSVTAELADNESAQALARMLPITLVMRDHLRQEKTGALPATLPEGPRQQSFSAGTLGLWGGRDLVIYYRSGRVPEPGIIIIGKIAGNTAIFDRPGAISVRVSRVK